MNEWLQVVGPLVGVILGASLSRGGSRTTFVRERTFAEIERRRETYADFTDKLWSYKARVQTTRELAAGRSLSPEDWTPKPGATAVLNIAEVNRAQSACREAFARVRFFASEDAQTAAFEAMEALTLSLNATAFNIKADSDRHFNEFTAKHEAFMNALNAEIQMMNLVAYVYGTRWFRILLGRLRREPLPFKVGDEIPTAPADPRERVLQQ